MQIILEQLQADKDSYIKNFTTFDNFCTLTLAQDLRKKSFANTYVQGLYEQMQDDCIMSQKRKAIIQAHEAELDEIPLLLKDLGYTIKILKENVNLFRDKEKIL